MLRSARASKYEEDVLNVASISGSFDRGKPPTRRSPFMLIGKGLRVTFHVKSSIWLRDSILGKERMESRSKIPASCPYSISSLSWSMFGSRIPRSSLGQPGVLRASYNFFFVLDIVHHDEWAQF